MPSIDEYSVSTLPLIMKCREAIIGQATGFFYEREECIFLVSNWHVFSGRNPYTGQAIRRDAALPDAVSLPLHDKNVIGNFVEGYQAKLLDDHGNATWRQHARGQDVDVALIPITGIPPNCTAYTLPREGEVCDMAFRIAMDAYILGFPKGITHQKCLPIWKRASIATEPDISHNDNLPIFLVDTATREGMSGAPVILRSFGGYSTDSGGEVLGSGIYSRFVGIYSGRLGAEEELGAQLGRVWHRSVIDEIIENGVKGSYELRSQGT